MAVTWNAAGGSAPEAVAAMRFGYGPRRGAVDARPPGVALAAPAGPDGYERFTAAAVMAEVRALAEARKRAQSGVADEAAAGRADYDRIRAGIVATSRRAARVAVARAVDANPGYRERLVRFWADHFTTAPRALRHRPLPVTLVDEAIRPHVTGRFATMLRAAALHPAMLIYLDQVVSVGPASRFGQRRGLGLNENLARELIELHTLGVAGSYDQRDVRELAELLTGVNVGAEGQTVFLPNRAEPGPEVVLGVTHGGDPARIEHVHAVLDDLAARTDTARHLARKLAVHFVADTPDPRLVEDLAAVWVATKGDLLAVAQALAEHPAAAGPQPGKVRQPFDYLVAALRALGLDGAAVMALPDRDFNRLVMGPLGAMGQTWVSPRGPDGWPEAAEAWITPQRLAARIEWAMQAPARLVPALPDPRSFVEDALAGLADDTLRLAAARAETETEGVGLVLASPAFNRR